MDVVVERIDRLMNRLGRPRKVIEGCEEYEGGQTPFLVRYTLAQIGQSHVYLHCFLRSDAGTDLHCHPWNFASLILYGGYVEVTPGGRRRKRPGMLLLRPASWAHRVELLSRPPLCCRNCACPICVGVDRATGIFGIGRVRPVRPSVSLVWTSGRKRDWGFFTPDGWIPWRQFFAQKGCNDIAETKVPQEKEQ